MIDRILKMTDKIIKWLNNVAMVEFIIARNKVHYNNE
jgi:hypothetical protein